MDASSERKCRRTYTTVEIQASAVVPAPVKIAWPTVSAFKSFWEVPAALLDGMKTGQVGTSIGSQRIVDIGAGRILEEVTGIDNEKWTLAYKLVSSPENINPFPASFLNYRCTCKLRRVSVTNETFVEICAKFMTEHHLADFMHHIWTRMVEDSLWNLCRHLTSTKGGQIAYPQPSFGLYARPQRQGPPVYSTPVMMDMDLGTSSPASPAVLGHLPSVPKSCFVMSSVDEQLLVNQMQSLRSSGLQGGIEKCSEANVLGCQLNSSSSSLSTHSLSRLSGPPTPDQWDQPRVTTGCRNVSIPMMVDRAPSSSSDGMCHPQSTKLDHAMSQGSLKRSGSSLPPRSPIPNPPLGSCEMQPMVSAMMDAVQRNLLS